MHVRYFGTFSLVVVIVADHQDIKLPPNFPVIQFAMICACLFIYCRATVFNSVPSSCTPVSIRINLLEDKPGPIENLQLIPTNVSVAVSWSPPDPLTRNGMISGYTLSLDGSVVCFFVRGY